MSRVLNGTIYVPNGDGSATAVLGGTSEADAKKQVGADVVGGWGEHVWGDAPEDFVAESPVAVIDDDAEPESASGSHRTRQRSGRPSGGE